MGFFKDAAKGLKKVAENPIVNIATLGASGTASKALGGDIKGAAVNQATAGFGGYSGNGQNGGIVDLAKNPAGALSDLGGAVGGVFGGLAPGSNPFSTQAADSAGLSAMSGQILDPVQAKMAQLGQTTISGGNVDPAFRQMQMSVAQQLQQQALGQGPSLAQMQLQQATDRTLNQSLGQIRAATGPNAALAGRTGALVAAQQMGQAGNASAQLRLQEQQQAQQALAGLSAQARAGDATTRGQDITAQMGQADTRLGAGKVEADLAARKLGTEEKIFDSQQEASMQKSKNSTEIGKAALGGAASAGAAALPILMSDETKKKNIKNVNMVNLLGSITPKEYDYKDPKNGQGKQVGLMAQDLEKTPYGKSMVIDTPQGKMVDTRKVAMAALAGVAALTKKKAKE